MTTKSIGSGLGANATGSGTVTATNLTKSIVGLTTLFTSEFIVGGPIGIDNVSYEVETITNDTHMTVTVVYAGTTGSTKTIQFGARNYRSLSAWASYVNALTLSAAEVGECYNDSEFTITTTVTFGGWASASSTNTVKLTCAAGQSFSDNANVQSNALRYNVSNGVGIRMTSSYTAALSVTGNFFIMEKVQIKNRLTGTDAGRGVGWGGGSGTFQTSIVQTYSGNSGATPGPLRVTGGSNIFQNLCLIEGGNGRGIDDVSYAANTYTDIVVVNVSGSSTREGFNVSGANNAVVTNTAVAGFSTDYSGTAKNTSSKNATDKGAFGGTNFGTSGQVSLVATTEWYSVTSGSEDLRLNTTSAKLKDNGATVGPSTDIAGTSRPQGSAYDIGCWELVVSSAAILPPDLFMQVAA